MVAKKFGELPIARRLRGLVRLDTTRPGGVEAHEALGGTDALFLSMETPSWHQHVAGLTVLDPGDRTVTFEDVVAKIGERIDSHRSSRGR